jgi:hypothetical protein
MCCHPQSRRVGEEFPSWSDIHRTLDRAADRSDPPEMAAWSKSQRMRGQKHRDDAHVLADETKNKVEQIDFRIDPSAISLEIVRRVCLLERQIGCVLMTC